MLKFYKEVVEGFLMMLVWMREYCKGAGIRPTMGDIRQELYRWLESPACTAPVVSKNILMGAIDRAQSEPLELEGMIEKIEEQLNRSIEKGVEKELLDTVVELFQLPYINNRLSGKVIKHLRDAILVPEEIRKVKNEILAGETKCAVCGKAMGHGEMGSLRIDPNGVGVVCTRCKIPEFFSCHSCDEGIVLPDNTRRMLEKNVTCKDCKEKLEKSRNGIPVLGPDIAPPPPQAAEIREIVYGEAPLDVGQPRDGAAGRVNFRFFEPPVPPPRAPRAIRMDVGPLERELRRIAQGDVGHNENVPFDYIPDDVHPNDDGGF